MTKKPVHIITGFLGAGKTTFLNEFIKEQLPERVFVIENECGVTNVDGALVMEGAAEVADLNAGCLCCSLADELVDVLREGYKMRDEYDRMIIETTGIADPSSIIQVFFENPAVEKVYDLQQVICLVDAGQIAEWLTETEEALRQIALADVILLNKKDTISKAYLKKVKKYMEAINPNAGIFSGEHGLFPFQKILEIGTIVPESVEKLASKKTHDHNQEGGENNSHRISTFTLTFPSPLDLNDLQLELNKIVQLYRHQVYRVKGFIAIPNYPNRIILQSARSTFIATDGSPWETKDRREGKLVFIGRDLEKKTFEKMFNRHMV